MKRAWLRGKTCYLPRLVGRNMQFHRYERGNRLVKNHYGIPEPLVGAASIAPCNLDLVCLPLVAFDTAGRRLGMGGGFYDRCFQFKQASLYAHKRKPLLIGLAHNIQNVECIPLEHWDITLDTIISDKRIITLSSQLPV